MDLGSNTFRLVVFADQPGRPPRLIDEIRDPVRLSAGMDEGVIRPDAIVRARQAARAYARFCRTVGIEDVVVVATSAIREAANQDEVLTALGGEEGLRVRVISTEQEARYGCLGVVNSTTLTDGGVLDIGGGSMQLSRIADRRMTDFISHPLGAVRATEGFLTDDPPKKKQLRELRRAVDTALEDVGWPAELGGRLCGTGGSIRTLAAMAQKRDGYPLSEVHGYALSAATLDELIAEMAATDAAGRANIAGLKTDRADIMLGAAIVASRVMEACDAERIEVCSGGLREGVYFERCLGTDALLDSVRRATVLGLAEAYRAEMTHCRHVGFVAERLYEAICAAGLHVDDPVEREWLWAAAMLHDVGVLIDYHDHHKHSQYLVLNAGLPGFDHRELAIIVTLIRGHRKRLPNPEPYASLLHDDDPARIDRLAVCLRLAEQLERGRSQAITDLEAESDGSTLRVVVECEADPSIAVWAASQEEPIVERALGLRLAVDYSTKLSSASSELGGAGVPSSVT